MKRLTPAGESALETILMVSSLYFGIAVFAVILGGVSRVAVLMIVVSIAIMGYCIRRLRIDRKAGEQRRQAAEYAED